MNLREELIRYAKWYDRNTMPEDAQTSQDDLVHNVDVYLKIEIKEKDFEWVCNECNCPNLTSSVPESEIEMELHSCINCGCFEMHKRDK